MKHQFITATIVLAAMLFVACPTSGYSSINIPEDMNTAVNINTADGMDATETIEIKADTVKADTSDVIVPALNRLIHADDFLLLTQGKETALNILSSLDNDVYGNREVPMVRNLLTSKHQTVSLHELKDYRRVRSIQVNNSGIFSYPYFTCRFKDSGGKMFFEKTTGSQRKSGYVYETTRETMVFLGGWSVNNDPQTTYNSPNSVAGMVYKIGTGKIIMLFVMSNQTFEIYELKK